MTSVKLQPSDLLVCQRGPHLDGLLDEGGAIAVYFIRDLARNAATILQALLASDEPSADRVALEGADNALANSRVTIVRSVFFWSCGTSLRSPHHAPQSGHGWFDGAQRAPSNHPTPVTGSESAQPQEVPNRANSARLAAPLA